MRFPIRNRETGLPFETSYCVKRLGLYCVAIKQHGMVSTSDDDGQISKLSSMLDPSNFPQSLHDESKSIHVELRYDVLDINSAARFTRSPTAGANVLFVGTTRNNFDNRPVSRLSYQAYPKLALSTLLKVAGEVKIKHKLEKVIIVHRLGEVPVEEESIVVGVSSGHRGEGWKGAEELLERVKERAEIWKREWFADTDSEGQPEGVWKANKDTDAHGRSTGTATPLHGDVP